MKKIVGLLFIFILAATTVFVLTSVSENPQQTGLSKAALKEIENRKNNYKKKKLEECYTNALNNVARMVDSALLEQALFIGADTMSRPDRPDRPEAEAFTSNIENLPIKPWLKKNDFISPFQKKDTFAVDSIKNKDSLQHIRKNSNKK